MSYEDIIHMPHPTSKRHKRMSLEQRAAQFSPFAALTGYEDSLLEAKRITTDRRELSEEEKEELDRKQQILSEHLKEKPVITVTYFIPDSYKEGGRYETITGSLKKIDTIKKQFIFTDGSKIDIHQITEIDSALCKDE